MCGLQCNARVWSGVIEILTSGVSTHCDERSWVYSHTGVLQLSKRQFEHTTSKKVDYVTTIKPSRRMKEGARVTVMVKKGAPPPHIGWSLTDRDFYTHPFTSAHVRTLLWTPDPVSSTTTPLKDIKTSLHDYKARTHIITVWKENGHTRAISSFVFWGKQRLSQLLPQLLQSNYTDNTSIVHLGVHSGLTVPLCLGSFWVVEVIPPVRHMFRPTCELATVAPSCVILCGCVTLQAQQTWLTCGQRTRRTCLVWKW